MRTTLLSALAFGACASMAVAEPLLPAGGAEDNTVGHSNPGEPVALTEAEMDKVVAGMKIKMTDVIISNYSTGGSSDRGDVLAWSWGSAQYSAQ